jgi:hypothetical protein
MWKRVVVTLVLLVFVALTANACAWMGCIDNPCRANKGTWVENDDEKCGGHCEYPYSGSPPGWSPPGPSTTTDASADAPADAPADSAIDADETHADGADGPDGEVTDAPLG